VKRLAVPVLPIDSQKISVLVYLLWKVNMVLTFENSFRSISSLFNSTAMLSTRAAIFMLALVKRWRSSSSCCLTMRKFSNVRALV
jgi:hypothetical protein